MSRPRLLALAAVLLGACAAPAADWPQWLGPNRDGSSPEKVAPWKGDLKVLWRKPVGEGHSGPVVANGVVYLHVKPRGKEAESVLAFDAKTGEPKWERTYERPAVMIPFGNGPRATPTVDGDRIYAVGITGILTCLDTKDGKILWQVDTLKEFNAPNLKFGISTSPLVEGDRVLMMVGGKGSAVVAFDRAKGKVLWKSGDDPASYSSPVAFGTGAQRQAVFLTGANLLSLSPSDGSIFWKVPFKDLLNESSTTPVKLGELLIGSSVTAGSIGLKLGEKDGKPSASEAWKNPALTCYFATPIAVDSKHLFMVTGALALNPTATLRCVDAASGKEVWGRPKVGKYHASLLKTGDGSLLMLDDSGVLSLIAPDVKQFKELAKAKVCGGNGDTWAHPALANGRLYVRDGKELICLQIGIEN